MMKIYVATGAGKGQSEIAALDAALAEAGALNFNLIPKIIDMLFPNIVAKNLKF